MKRIYYNIIWSQRYIFLQNGRVFFISVILKIYWNFFRRWKKIQFQTLEFLLKRYFAPSIGVNDLKRYKWMIYDKIMDK